MRQCLKAHYERWLNAIKNFDGFDLNKSEN